MRLPRATENDHRFDWIDALSIAGLVAALYVVFELLRKASWPAVSIIDGVLLAAGMATGIAALVLSGTALAGVVMATGPVSRSLFIPCVIAANRTVLSKYLPGKIWYVIGIAESLVHAGMSRARAWGAVLLYQVVVIGTALLLGLMGIWEIGLFQYFPDPGSQATALWWGLITLAVIAGIAGSVFWLVRRKPARAIREVRLRWIVGGTLFSFGHWIMQGLSVWLVLSALHDEWLDAIMILLVPGIHALGFLVLIAPGGMGVRELLFMQYFLHLGLSVETAAALAILARVTSLVVEICVWLLLHMLRRRIAPRLASGPVV